MRRQPKTTSKTPVKSGEIWMVESGFSNRLSMVVVLQSKTLLVAEVRYDSVLLDADTISHFDWLRCGLSRKSVVHVANTCHKKRSNFERKIGRITKEELDHAWSAYTSYRDSRPEVQEG